ncbi:TPA: glycoside hydrolase family 9 protein [Photobacterium damselae]
MQLLTNHLGYERLGSKQAIILTPEPLVTPGSAELVSYPSGQTVMTLPIKANTPIAQWHIGLTYQVDFSACQQVGQYAIRYQGVLSSCFTIAEGLLFEQTFSDVIHYFKSQRCTGIYQQADKSIPLLGTDERIDVHGGWYDASGDISKYLSHLSYGNYLNPQQTPMVVWNMLKAYQLLEDEADVAKFTRVRLLEEALYGADFLVRMQHPDGYFYMTVFDQWSKDPARRDICAFATQQGDKSADFQAAFRQGGGIAIAALASAARIHQLASVQESPYLGQTNHQEYLACAERGYWHLKEYNLNYLNDGHENLLDEYCALMAAVELYKTTQNVRYIQEARTWALRVMSRQCSDEQQQHFWAANSDGSRPYYHAAEAGLPAIALLQYVAIEPQDQERLAAEQVIKQALQFELTISQEVSNPFGYPRQYIKAIDGQKQSAFFMPHNNETGYWWQGENARLGSLATLAYFATAHLPNDTLTQPLKRYAHQLLDWVIGLNPYDMCMLDGHGRNNPDYLPELGFANAPGGVCNGITSGFDNEQDIAFKPAQQKDDMLQNWRWGEQWIPHGAWYLLAITAQYKERHHD